MLAAEVRRNITQGAFTIFCRNVAARSGLYRPRRRGISMQICFMPGRFRRKDKDEGRDKALGVSRTALIKNVPGDALPQQDWREPPGYLGEAVRRAKRISSASQNPPSPAIANDR